MTGAHPNLALLATLNLQDSDSCRSTLAEDFVWHYVNTHLPDLEDDYHGIDGLKGIFEKLGAVDPEPAAIAGR